MSKSGSADGRRTLRDLEGLLKRRGVEAESAYRSEVERILGEEPLLPRDVARMRAAGVVLGVEVEGGLGGVGGGGEMDESVARASSWEEQFSPGLMERNVSWVASILGGLTEVPAPSFHALALLKFVRRGGYAEAAFWSGFYSKFLPSKREVDRRARQSDDGRSLSALCDTLSRFAGGSEGVEGESGVPEEGVGEGGDGPGVSG